MKSSLSMIVFAVSMAMSVMASADIKENLYVYKCGQSTVTVTKAGSKYSVRKVYQVGTSNRIVTIDSERSTVKNLIANFTGGDTVVDDEVQTETGLPKNSLGLGGFHYPSGEMYVSAEGETNEDGYIFAVEKGLIEGAASVLGADVFWHDRRDSDVYKYTCTRVK